MKSLENLKYKKSMYIWAVVYIVLIISCILFRMAPIINNDKIFKNGDASWHVLLTMKAFEQTPSNTHHFLPIVSLGNIDDKNISWGATVPDNHGNYYYTSFSSAGFVAPYAFIKLFHLPMNESSLYIFNSVLMVLSLILLILLFSSLFGQEKLALICFLTIIVYVFQPEIMHSQGVVYWHHSLFQLLFLLQLNLYVRLNSNTNYILFFYYV